MSDASARASGEERLCQVTLVRLPSSVRLLRASFVDITERRPRTMALQRLNRTLRTISAANAALVRATTEKELLDDMCRVTVDTGGYRLAWIGFVEHDEAKTVRPVAWAGEHPEYVATANITWADAARGQGPTGTAIRTGEAQVTQNVESNPAMGPWLEELRKYGLKSSIALPLKDRSGVFGVLVLYAGEPDAFGPEEVSLLTQLADDLGFGIRAQRDHAGREAALNALKEALKSTVQAIATAVEMRDAYTAGHQLRVAELATAIAREIGLPEAQIEGLYLAATIHDVGKINVPAELLSKPGKLTSLEYQMLQTHVQTGYDIVKGVNFPWPIAQIILQHHERLDGSGYPQGLKGDAMLPEAKILAVADVVEAMMSHRPYRQALGVDAALAEIEKHKGRLYDPAAVDACVALFRGKEFEFDRVAPASVSGAPAPPSHPVLHACGLFLAVAVGVSLGFVSHPKAYDLPALNLGTTSAFDGSMPLTGPGFYGIEYFTFYSASKFTGANGQKLPLPSQDLQVLAPITQVVYLAPQKVFGIAHPGATVILPAVAGAGVNDGLNGAVLRTSTGLGDTIFGAFLTFDPIMGQNGPRFAQSIEFDVFTPTGRYDRNIAINPGSHFLSINPFYAATFWATPDWTFSGRFHYLWNATNNEPNFSLGPEARTSQAGQAFHMNLHDALPAHAAWGVGLNGYYLQQLTDLRVNGQAAPGTLERVAAIGPFLTFALNKDYSVFLNAYKEFGAENRPEGERVILRFNAYF